MGQVRGNTRGVDDIKETELVDTKCLIHASWLPNRIHLCHQWVDFQEKGQWLANSACNANQAKSRESRRMGIPAAPRTTALTISLDCLDAGGGLREKSLIDSMTSQPRAECGYLRTLVLDYYVI